ncbi:MAG: GTPase HflX, partial [Caedimonadaceae bacterium]
MIDDLSSKAGSETKALVLHIDIQTVDRHYSPEYCLEEAIGLAHAISLNVIHAEIIPLKKIIPSTLLGQGSVSRLKDVIDDLKPSLVIVNSTLTPIQQRTLERHWSVKVIDRVGLIIEIFGARARTAEGSLQVELAALSYQRSRLVRSWTHLERQRGGFGFTGGPGEKQLEMDRRLIDERIVRIKRDLEKVKQTRGLHRKSRKKVPYPIVALVGYT